MPSPSSAEISHPLAFPDKIGESLWRERRTSPAAAFLGVPLVVLAGGAVAVSPIALRLAFAVAAAGVVVLLVWVRRRSLIETYAVSERFLTVEQPGGGRVAIPTAAVEHVTLQGDKVRIESSIGVVTLGFVRRQRALVRALERAVPGVVVERDMTAFCRT